MKKLAAILGVVVLVGVLGWMFIPVKLDGNADQTNQAQAMAEMRVILAAITEFHKDRGKYPDRLDELALPRAEGQTAFLKDATNVKDPWGSPYIYRSSPPGFLLYSAGPNRRDDSQGNDDLSANPR